MGNAANQPVERSVQLAGNTTFVVSLPKSWALEQGLEPGASMHLYPHRDRVVVAPASLESSERQVAIDAGAMNADVVCHRVRAAYAAGADRIVVSDHDGLERDLRRRVTRLFAGLVGMDVSEETPERLVANDFLDAADVSLPQTTAQLRQHARSMFDDAIEAVLTDDEALAARVTDRTDDVDRLVAFVSRGFHRGLEDITEIDRLDVDRASAFHSYQIARGLERLADHAERIATIADRQSGPPTVAPALEAVAADALTVVELALEGSPDRALSMQSRVVSSIESLDRQLSSECDPNTYLHGSVLERVRRTAALGVSLTGPAIETGGQQ